MKAGAFDHRVGTTEPVVTRAQRLDYLQRFWAEDERVLVDAPSPRDFMGDGAYRVLALLRAGLTPQEVASALKISRPRVDTAAAAALRCVRIPLGRT